MLRKLLFILLLGAAAMSARFFVRIGPPPVVVESPVAAPAPGYVWIPGYYRWDGGAYVWVPGGWVAAPWPGARRIPPRWVHQQGGWTFVGGYWR